MYKMHVKRWNNTQNLRGVSGRGEGNDGERGDELYVGGVVKKRRCF